MMVVICEDAYIISFICTTYSRFTSTTIKKSRHLTLLRDSKYVVELAVASARYKPSGHTILLSFSPYEEDPFRILVFLKVPKGSILNSFAPPRGGIYYRK
jgi:hypothetical protein